MIAQQHLVKRYDTEAESPSEISKVNPNQSTSQTQQALERTQKLTPTMRRRRGVSGSTSTYVKKILTINLSGSFVGVGVLFNFPALDASSPRRGLEVCVPRA